MKRFLDLPTVVRRMDGRNSETDMQSFKVSGMTCEHCVRAVTDAIKGVDAAAAVEVDLGAGTVTVRDDTAPHSHIADAIRAEGYTVERLAA